MAPTRCRSEQNVLERGGSEGLPFPIRDFIRVDDDCSEEIGVDVDFPPFLFSNGADEASLVFEQDEVGGSGRCDHRALAGRVDDDRTQQVGLDVEFSAGFALERANEDRAVL